MLIAPDDFNNQRLLEIYQSAYIDAEMDDDGDVVLTYEGVRLRAWVDTDRQLFIVSGVWNLKAEATRVQILELCNRVNARLIMVRCCYPPAMTKPGFYLDHTTITEGGITGEEIVKVTRRFVAVARDIKKLDDDGLFL